VAKSFRDLIVWQKGIQLSVMVHRLSKSFPREDLYGLTSQMRGAAVSIPSNIAEGSGRLGTPEYRQFLGIARGSNFELQTQLTIAKELGFGDSSEIALAEGLSSEVGKMIFATIATLNENEELRPLTTGH
jgi:four helix bundle protein